MGRTFPVSLIAILRRDGHLSAAFVHRPAISRVKPALLVFALVCLGACNPAVTAPVVVLATLNSGNAQTATVTQALAAPLIVHLATATGLSVGGGIVTWAIASGGGSLSAPTSISDSLGNARVTYTAGTVAGTVTINAGYSTTSDIAFTATVVSGTPATIGIVSGDLQSGPINTTLLLPLVVQVNDRYGNPSVGAPIVWFMVGGGTLSTTNTATDGTGRARVTVATGATAGARTISASSVNIGAANFSAIITN